jgi:hypothetical protein
VNVNVTDPLWTIRRAPDGRRAVWTGYHWATLDQQGDQVPPLEAAEWEVAGNVAEAVGADVDFLLDESERMLAQHAADVAEIRELRGVIGDLERDLAERDRLRSQRDAALALADDLLAAHRIECRVSEGITAGWTVGVSVRGDIADGWIERRRALTEVTA